MKLPMMVLPPSMRSKADPSEAVDDKRADGATSSRAGGSRINGEAGVVPAFIPASSTIGVPANEMRRAVDDHLVNRNQAVLTRERSRRLPEQGWSKAIVSLAPNR